MKARFEGFAPIRHDRLMMEESRHDPYQLKHKLAEPTLCPDCQAVYHAGHWQWMKVPTGARSHPCPACQRIRDDFPAGYVQVAGPFFQEHRAEMLQQIQHQAAKARMEHPLQRIMQITSEDDGVLVTTTDIHLARGLGEHLHHAYQGELEFHYNAAENLLRVMWRR